MTVDQSMLGRRGPDDHHRRCPVAAAPVRAPRPPEWVVIVRPCATLVVGPALGPQVDVVGIDQGIGVVVASDRMFLRARKRAGHGDFAILLVQFRIVETTAAGDEAAAALRTRAWSRIVVERARKDFETGLVRFRIDRDDVAAPAHAVAMHALLRGLLRRDCVEILASELRRHAGATSQRKRAECGGGYEEITHGGLLRFSRLMTIVQPR